MDDRLERNKKSAMVFYDLMFNQCKRAGASEKLAGHLHWVQAIWCVVSTRVITNVLCDSTLIGLNQC